VNKEWENKLLSIMTSPMEGKICVERREKEVSENIDKEKQQDFYILQNQQEISAFIGEMVGKSGNGGTIGEIKTTLTILNERIISLQNLFHSLEKGLEIQGSEEKGKINEQKKEIETLKQKVSILEKESGKRVISLLAFIVMTIIIISFEVLTK
jgi:hypothetical protein